MIPLTFNPGLALWTTWPCFEQVNTTLARDPIEKPSVVVVVVVVARTRPRAIPLAMITMRKSTHGFPFLFHALRGPSPELRYNSNVYLSNRPQVSMGYFAPCKVIRNPESR